MFHSNKIRYIILILFVFFFLPNVYAVVEPTSRFYINDYANILSSETEEYIFNKSRALDEVDGTQIVVVTVPNLEGKSLESYSLELFRNFDIGDNEKNNGLLLLLALEERMFRIEVGTGLEGILPDGKTGRFQELYIIPYLAEDKWDKGIKNGYNAFYSEIVKLNNLNLLYTDGIPNYYETDDIDDTSIVSELLGFIFIFSIYGFFFGMITRCVRKPALFAFIYLTSLLLLCIFFSDVIIIFLVNFIFYMFAIVFFKDAKSKGRSRSSGRSYRSDFYMKSSSRSSSYRRNSSSRSYSGGGGTSRGGGSSRRF